MDYLLAVLQIDSKQLAEVSNHAIIGLRSTPIGLRSPPSLVAAQCIQCEASLCDEAEDAENPSYTHFC